MFFLYERGHRPSRMFGVPAARFFIQNQQYPRTPGQRVYVIYLAM